MINYDRLLIPEPIASIPRHNGEDLNRFIKDRGYKRTLEVGFAWGVSASYIIDATKAIHTVIDPYQASRWHNYGILNLKQHELDQYLHLLEEPSHYALPPLAQSGKKIEFAFIDGNHLFDFAFIDAYYIDIMLEEGGVVCLDDILYFPAVEKVKKWLLSNKNYTQIHSDDRLQYFQKHSIDRHSNSKHYVDF